MPRWEQRAVLHHHADAALVGGHRLHLIDQALAIERDASEVGASKPAMRRSNVVLAGSSDGPTMAVRLPRNAQIDAVQRGHGAEFAQARHLQKAHRSASRRDCRKSSQVSGSEITIMIKA